MEGWRAACFSMLPHDGLLGVCLRRAGASYSIGKGPSASVCTQRWARCMAGELMGWCGAVGTAYRIESSFIV